MARSGDDLLIQDQVQWIESDCAVPGANDDRATAGAETVNGSLKGHAMADEVDGGLHTVAASQSPHFVRDICHRANVNSFVCAQLPCQIKLLVRNIGCDHTRSKAFRNLDTVHTETATGANEQNIVVRIDARSLAS